MQRYNLMRTTDGQTQKVGSALGSPGIGINRIISNVIIAFAVGVEYTIVPQGGGNSFRILEGELELVGLDEAPFVYFLGLEVIH